MNWRNRLRELARRGELTGHQAYKWNLARGEPVPRKVLIDRYRAAKGAGILPERMVLTPAEKIAVGIPKYRAWNESVGLGGSCRPEPIEKLRKRQAAQARRQAVSVAVNPSAYFRMLAE